MPHEERACFPRLPISSELVNWLSSPVSLLASLLLHQAKLLLHLYCHPGSSPPYLRRYYHLDELPII